MTSDGVPLAFNRPARKMPFVPLEPMMVAPPPAASVRLLLRKTPVLPFELPLTVTVPEAFTAPLILTPYLALPTPVIVTLSADPMLPVKKTPAELPLLWPLRITSPVAFKVPLKVVPPTASVVLRLPTPLTVRLATVALPLTLTP